AGSGCPRPELSGEGGALTIATLATEGSGSSTQPQAPKPQGEAPRMRQSPGPPLEGETIVVEARSSENGEVRGPDLDRIRSVAQLNMLHSLAAKLNALGDVKGIGEAIAAELRTII